MGAWQLSPLLSHILMWAPLSHTQSWERGRDPVLAGQAVWFHLILCSKASAHRAQLCTTHWTKGVLNTLMRASRKHCDKDKDTMYGIDHQVKPTCKPWDSSSSYVVNPGFYSLSHTHYTLMAMRILPSTLNVNHEVTSHHRLWAGIRLELKP